MKTINYLFKKLNGVMLFLCFFFFSPFLHAQYYHGFYENTDPLNIQQDDKCYSGMVHTDINTSVTEYVMVGAANHHGQYYGLSLDFLKTDQTGMMSIGETISFTDVGTGVVYNSRGLKVIRTSNTFYEEYAVTGYIFSSIGPTSNLDILFMLIDGGDGSITVAKRFDFTLNGSPEAQDRGHSICQNPWGDFVIVGESGDDITGYNMAVLEVYGHGGPGALGSIRTSATYDFSASPIFSGASPIITRTDESANDVTQDYNINGGNWNIFHIVGEVRYDNGKMLPFILTMTQHLYVFGGGGTPAPGGIVSGEIRSGYDNYSFTCIKRADYPRAGSYIILGHLDDYNARCMIENMSYNYISTYNTNWSNIFDHGYTDAFEVPYDVAERAYGVDGGTYIEYAVVATKYNTGGGIDDREFADIFSEAGMTYYRLDQNGQIVDKTVYEELVRSSGKAIGFDLNSNDPAIVIMGGGGDDPLLPYSANILVVRSYFNGVSGTSGHAVCEYDKPFFANVAHADVDNAISSGLTESAAEYGLDYTIYEMLENVPCNNTWLGGSNDDIPLIEGTPTGVKKHTGESRMLLYPSYLGAGINTIHLKGLSHKGPVEITCMNVLGQQVSFSIKAENGIHQLEFNKLSAGNYFIMVNENGVTSTYKFTKAAE